MSTDATRNEMSRPTTALKPLVGNPIAGLYDEQQAVGQYLMNFSPTDPDGEELLFLSESQGTRDALQHTERPFMCRWWLAKSIEMPDVASGEMARVVRIVLISPDRDVLAFVSIGAAASLDLIRATRGEGPYDPPLQLLVHVERTRAGRTMYRLRPFIDRQSI